MTDFEAWLQKGLGRAAVFLKKNDARLWRKQLLYACTHCLTYDPQCEDGRAHYLLKLIEISGEPEFYRDRITECLSSDDEELDIGQMFEIVGKFANQSSVVRRAMYAAFEKHGFVGAGLGSADQLVILDGTSGLLFAMRRFGEEEERDRPWQFRHLIETLEKHHGHQPLPSELDRFVRELNDFEKPAQKSPKLRMSYDALKQSLTRANAMIWSHDASPGELALAADDLLTESDDKRLAAYLNIFRKHVFPGPLDRLIDMARSSHDAVARGAVAALSKIRDQRVRDLGLQLIAGRNRLELAVELLIQNAEPGDYRIFEELLAESHEPYVYHGMSFDIRDYITAHRSEDAERSLLLLYENGPCSTCRRGVVEELMAINHLPGWMREECQYDAYSKTRSLVSTNTVRHHI
jgi:hypothetical protein